MMNGGRLLQVWGGVYVNYFLGKSKWCIKNREATQWKSEEEFRARGTGGVKYMRNGGGGSGVAVKEKNMACRCSLVPSTRPPLHGGFEGGLALEVGGCGVCDGARSPLVLGRSLARTWLDGDRQGVMCGAEWLSVTWQAHHSRS